jgi:hypothetical protein
MRTRRSQGNISGLRSSFFIFLITMTFGASFLTDPAAFPNPYEAVNGGERAVDIHFAGGPYRFTGLDNAQLNRVETRFADYCHSANASGDTAVTTRVFTCEQNRFRRAVFKNGEYSFDRDYAQHSVRLAGPDFMAAISWSPALNGALWIGENADEQFACAFENFFRVLAAYRLLQLGGTILHSACVATEGRAYILLGHSGAGKTTFSRMALQCGWDVLSDDMNAVCLKDNRCYVEKLPFAGGLGQTPSRGKVYPLAGIFTLQKSGNNRLHGLTTCQALAKTFCCAPVINGDPYRLDLLLSSLETLLHAVPAARLEFSLDGGALNLLPRLN